MIWFQWIIDYGIQVSVLWAMMTAYIPKVRRVVLRMGFQI